jgi:uncharacterized repeat protein (TIGR03803 family)
MRISDVSRYALSSCVASVILAGCGGSQPLIGTQSAVPQAPTSTSYKSLYSFGEGSDGQDPKAALIVVNGTLYGTTYGGGVHADGTVFTAGTSGAEKVLYSFQGGNDGANPSASLLAVKGVLYGTTEYGGGAESLGTVFKISTEGSEKVLHDFGPVPDGANPVASLINVKGRLYGTTYNGGSGTFPDGAVFEISKRGKENVLHSFSVYFDGAGPVANLLDVNGTLYGTTSYGVGETESTGGYGTVFSVTTTGTEHILYNFIPRRGGAALPRDGLVNVKGTLYGTTYGGGAYGFGGTAFSITTSGSLTILHNFGSGTDGSEPYAPLLNVKGALYGTTSSGGTYDKGTVFRMSLTGNEKVLHSFGYSSDGAAPLVGLVEVHGTLYGTTSAGGANGEGTVFALTP